MSDRRSMLTKAAFTGSVSLIAIMSTPAAAQAVCVTTPLGVFDCAPDGPDAVVNLPGQPTPVTVTLPDAYTAVGTLLVDAAGPVTIDADALISTVLDNQPALDLTSDASILAQVNALSTQGNNSPAALLRAVDDVIFVADGAITTVGDLADGLNVQAGSADITLTEARTVGIDSDGVEIVTLTGPATLNADLIETLGSGSTDAIIRAAGDIGVNVGVLRTGGDQALGLDLQSDATACAVLGAGSCDVNAIVSSITTDGFGSIGALVVAAGDTDLSIDVLQTNGDEAAGLDLSADPTACVALGVGACDTAFTVNNLTTNGARSPGAVVRAVGDIDGSIGILTTNGDDAIGLDLASDPTACAILGTGACETSFSVGQLTTSGDGAIGALVRAAGPTTANIGILETAGDGATGLDIAADPQACVVLGLGQCVTSITADRITTLGDLAAGVLVVSPADVVADLGVVETAGLNAPAVSIIADPAACVLLGTGACDATLTGDRITTLGDGSLGVLVNTPGQIVADLGLVETDGDNSPGITLITDPAVCALLGAGSCGVILGGGGPGGDGPDIDTGGDKSPGVVVDSPGPIDVDVDDVDTDGDNSPGIDIDGGEGSITVDFGDVSTDGDNSPGVDVDGTGPIDVTGDSVTTGGANSPGVIVTGDDGPVTVNVGPVTTTGPGSNGIDVTTTSGNQMIVAGPVTVTGQGSSGIVGTATGCANVSITATGPVSSASGIGIDAASACTVSVTTLPGANVSGGVAGIEATSGTGSTITIGAGLSSTGGPALDADGGAATVVVGPTGSITGRIDLTDNADRLTNNGTILANQSSDFGAGADVLVNVGLIRTVGAVSFAGLETLTNTGLIDMRDGDTNDRLTLPGTYAGSGNAALGVDVGAGTASDRLVVGGAATGSTAVLIAADGSFTNGAVVVDAGAGTSATAFTLPATTVGLTDYALVFDPASNNFAVFGTPNIAAVGASLVADSARQVFYRGNEAVAGHLGSGDGSGENPRVSRALWFQGFGMVQHRDQTLDTNVFGQARSYDLDSQQDWFGGQIGADILGSGGSVLGVTAGFIDSTLKLKAAPVRVGYEAWNAGLYGRVDFGAAFVRGLAKYEHYKVDYRTAPSTVASRTSGDGWGGWLEVGARLGMGVLFVEPAASIEYVNLDLDGFDLAGTGFDLDEDEGLRGKAGVKVGSVLSDGPTRVVAYAGAQAIHEFQGRDRLVLSNTGGTVDFVGPRNDTYGRATVGFSATTGDRVRGFIEGTMDFAGGVSGGGARAGLAIAF